MNGETGMKAWSVMSIAAVALAAALAACDAGPSAVAGNPAGKAEAPARQARAERVPLVNGRPMWAANRRHSARSNAAFQYRRNGRDFGVASQDEYVAAAHAFIGHPPAGVQTIARRNGDRVLYDPAQNIFAVVTAEGAPRTLYTPRDGAAYFRREQERASRQTAAADDGDSDAGEDRQAS
jgi:pyocin large subunit-like protein